MSELSVGSLSGLAANSYVIDVASGSSLDLSNGATLPAGSIVAVESVTKTDTFSTTSTSYTDITDLEATITPSSTSSKILIFVSVSVNAVSTTPQPSIEIRRGAVTVGSGAASGSRGNAFASFYTRDDFGTGTLAGEFLDTPSTTSSTTYTIRIRTNQGTVRVNTTGDDSNAASSPRTSSSITLMEIAG